MGTATLSIPEGRATGVSIFAVLTLAADGSPFNVSTTFVVKTSVTMLFATSSVVLV